VVQPIKAAGSLKTTPISVKPLMPLIFKESV